MRFVARIIILSLFAFSLSSGGTSYAETPQIQTPNGGSLELEWAFDCPSPLEVAWGEWARQGCVLSAQCITPGGQPHGSVACWDTAGELVAQGSYYEGAPHGTWVERDRQQGEVRTGAFENGLKQGSWRTEYEDGSSRVCEWVEATETSCNPPYEMVVEDQVQPERYPLPLPSAPEYWTWWGRISPRQDIPLGDQGAFLNLWGLVGGAIFGAPGFAFDVGARAGALMPDEEDPGFAYDTWALVGVGGVWEYFEVALTSGIGSFKGGDWIDASFSVPVKLWISGWFNDLLGITGGVRVDYPIASSQRADAQKDLGGLEYSAELLLGIQPVDWERGIFPGIDTSMRVEVGMVARSIGDAWMLGLTWRVGFSGRDRD